MKQVRDRVQWRLTSGDPISVGDLTITPQARSLTLRWPGWGLVWNRPVAVVVERDGRRERIPIVDVTRMAQIAMLGCAVVLCLGILALSGRQRRDRHGQ